MKIISLKNKLRIKSLRKWKLARNPANKNKLSRILNFGGFKKIIYIKVSLSLRLYFNNVCKSNVNLSGATPLWRKWILDSYYLKREKNISKFYFIKLIPNTFNYFNLFSNYSNKAKLQKNQRGNIFSWFSKQDFCAWITSLSKCFKLYIFMLLIIERLYNAKNKYS